MQTNLFQTVRNAFYNANMTNGLSQKALAEKIEASPQMMRKWLKDEKSFSKIRLENLQSICEVLGLELELKNINHSPQGK